MHKLKTLPSINEIESLNPKVKALIFDMDGTVLDSELFHAKALFKTLDSFQTQYKDPAGLMNEYIGYSDVSVFEDLKSKKILPEHVDLDIFLEKKNHCMLQVINSHDPSTCIIEGMTPFLEQVSRIFTVCLVTASERVITDALLSSLQIDKLFEFSLTRNDTKKSKPDPQPYLKAIEKLGMKKEEVLIFEDSESGLQSAKASGAPYVKVLWYKH